MLAKKFRLPAENFFAKPIKRFVAEYFLVKVFKNKLGYNRFGVIINNRVDKRSTRRHFLKRLILSRARQQPNSSRDFLIIASPRAGKLSRVEIKKEIKKIFENIKSI